MVVAVSASVQSAAATHVLAAGLVASRFGLWTFDLCVSQLLQECVASQELGLPNHQPPHTPIADYSSVLQTCTYIIQEGE